MPVRTMEQLLGDLQRRIGRQERRFVQNIPDGTARLAALEEWSGENRPAFQARGVSTTSKSGTQTYSRLLLETELFDHTDNYDYTTGTFKAPVAGLYSITFSLAVTTSVGGPEARLYVNGADCGYSNLAIGYGAAYNTFGTTVVLPLEVDDEVEVWWQNNNNTSVTVDKTRSTFSGFYIG